MSKRKHADEGPQDEASGAGRGQSGGRGQPAGRGGGRGQPSGRGGGRGGENTTRPSAMRMLKTRSGRSHTVSVAIPSSIVENAQSAELKATLVGQLARALTIFAVDEIIVYEDQSSAPPSKDAEGHSRAMAFMTRNFQYLETPQYLRKQLLGMQADLRWVGLLNPLDAPHHLRKNEWLAYREGVVLEEDSAPAPHEKNRDGTPAGCWLNCGLHAPVWVEGQAIPPGIRVTVRMDDETSSGNVTYKGTAVAPDEPRTKMGLYWGYQTRIAKSFKAVFDECPFDGGYDLTMGTSERGEALGLSKLQKHKHFLLAFGPLGGFEEVIRDPLSGYKSSTDPATLFSRYVNIYPNQSSRTIRTEEALIMCLTSVSQHLPER